MIAESLVVMGMEPKPKTEKELKKEREKAEKLAKFEEKHKKLQKQKLAAANKPQDVCASIIGIIHPLYIHIYMSS